MIQVIRETKPIASKDYICMACDFIFALDSFDMGFTFSEYRKIVQARKNSYRIKKGDIYINQFNKHNDETYMFRAIPEIHAICIKYDLYQE